MRKSLGIPPQILIYLVNLVMDIVQGLLLLRLLLVLFGASTIAPFVRWVFETTEPLIFPFVGMFPSPKLTNGFTIEFASLFAIIFYLFIGYLITEVVDILVYQSSQRIIRK